MEVQVYNILTFLFGIKQLLNIQSYVASQTLAQKMIEYANKLQILNDKLFKFKFMIYKCVPQILQHDSL